jgi:RimJ/RimL family protein N-acetyltransferase
MRYAFDELGISTIWCGYFDGNEKSKRVNEKCGFRFLILKEIKNGR